jgi:hypothetical protein
MVSKKTTKKTTKPAKKVELRDLNATRASALKGGLVIKQKNTEDPVSESP